MKTKYPEWTRIPWDGNPALKLECWRKTFGSGHVSVGIGGFQTVVFSFGANDERSHSSTRWNYDNPVITEEEMMKGLDDWWKVCKRQRGCWNFTTPSHLHKKPEDWDQRSPEAKKRTTLCQ